MGCCYKRIYNTSLSGQVFAGNHSSVRTANTQHFKLVSLLSNKSGAVCSIWCNSILDDERIYTFEKQDEKSIGLSIVRLPWTSSKGISTKPKKKWHASNWKSITDLPIYDFEESSRQVYHALAIPTRLPVWAMLKQEGSNKERSEQRSVNYSIGCSSVWDI